MTLDQLEHFFTLSQCKNYTQAANQLYITQPALSKSIAALEKELQLHLVNRNTRTVTLTAAGERFSKTCGEILSTYRDGVNTAQSMSDNISGHLIFGLPSEHFDNAAVRFLAILKEVYPGIRAELRFYSSNGLLRALDNGRVDFIFAADWPRTEKLKYQRLEIHKNCAVLPCDHPLAQRKELSFKELKNETFLAISSMVSGKEHDTIIELSRACSQSPHLTYEASTIPELLMMVAIGRGVTILPENYRSISGDMTVFIPLKENSCTQEHILWKEHDNPCIQAVAKLAASR